MAAGSHESSIGIAASEIAGHERRLAAFAKRYGAENEAWRQTAWIGYRVAKRAFNFVFSLGVIVVLLVPCLLLSVAVALDTKGSPIYVSRRVGYRGREIGVLKFRSMVADADNVEKYLSKEQLAQWHTEMKVDHDPRITRLGRLLRNTSIDELPQFVNVLRGQMSVVGPRPITEAELAWFGDDAEELLSCHPGITGLWQVLERNGATYESGLRQEIELAYVRGRCLRMDTEIVKRTVGVMLGKNRSGR